MRRRWTALCVAAALVAGAAPLSGQSWNLASGWSDLANPFGPWSLFKNATDLFGVTQSDYWGDGSGQVAWSDEPFPGTAHVPVWMKTTTAVPSLHSFPVSIGSVIAHTAEAGRTGSLVTSVRWTSPTAGFASVLGGTWIRQPTRRPQVWEIFLNGSLLSGGDLIGGDGTSETSLFDFAAGSGGSAVSGFAVGAGDVVELRLTNEGSFGDFVGVDMTVELQPTVVPEPFTVLLLGTGLGFVGMVARRRRPGTAGPDDPGASDASGEA